MDETTNATETATEQPAKTFTQAEVDALMGKVRRETRDKFADYDDLKAKAGRYDELEEANKTELQKAQDEAAKAKAELERMSAEMERERLLAKVSEATGVPASLLHGATEDELTQSAEAVRAYARAAAPSVPVDEGGAPAGGRAVTVQSIEAIDNTLDRVRARARHADLYRQ